MEPNVVQGRESRQGSPLERELASIEHRALVESHRLRAIEYVTKTGMMAVTNITVLENALVQSVPNAAPRLRSMGDMAARAVAAEIAGILR